MLAVRRGHGTCAGAGVLQDVGVGSGVVQSETHKHCASSGVFNAAAEDRSRFLHCPEEFARGPQNPPLAHICSHAATFAGGPHSKLSPPITASCESGPPCTESLSSAKRACKRLKSAGRAVLRLTCSVQSLSRSNRHPSSQLNGCVPLCTGRQIQADAQTHGSGRQKQPVSARCPRGYAKTSTALYSRVTRAIGRVWTIPPVRSLHTLDVLEILNNQRAARHDADHQLRARSRLVHASKNRPHVDRILRAHRQGTHMHAVRAGRSS